MNNHSKTSLRVWLGLLCFAFMGLANATDLPEQSDPLAVGITNEKAGELQAALQSAVDAGKIPGAVLLVANRDSKGLLLYIGQQGPNDNASVNEDTLYRIFSMTKPVVSVAAMILVDQGKLSLNDPVSRYIPEFADLKVLDEVTGKVAPAKKVMTVEHLLTHESGLIYGVFDRGSRLGRAYLDGGASSSALTALELSKKLASLPVRFEPGTRWHYGRSTDVLGAVLEVASGLPLDALLDQLLFAPLGMKDTFFYVPADRAERLAEPFYGELGNPRVQKPMLSGGGGLVSSTKDYAQFGLMLINQGRHEGKQIIKPESLLLMQKPFIGERVSREHFFYKDNGDFGLGFGLLPIDPANPDSSYTYGWSGYAGTEFWVDPENGFFVVYMIQAHSVPGGVGFKPRRQVYNALSQ